MLKRLMCETGYVNRDVQLTNNFDGRCLRLQILDSIFDKTNP